MSAGLGPSEEGSGPLPVAPAVFSDEQPVSAIKAIAAIKKCFRTLLF